ncbi:histidine phosphatase family protein [Marinobacter halodurans]|uniref:Histidine phosphatase family protein n=1 Tax=Marinobacter halodurans TaxID=2528979 RepID=A0ABY1ZS52_9GAMM|nr:histidine phosphatase family protein [Marinobacter halodurans]TBW57905.1 histidine phosphatase family protein [Marinobacter halodurans]
MATLYLIRHGQASFGKANYDQLSDTGWEQGRVLGRWLADKVTPTAVFSGDLQRHQETVAAITEGYGQALPDLQMNAGFNEFDHEAVVHAFKPEWADREVMARDLAQHPKPARAFQLAFVEAVQRWVSGDYASEYAESWADFQTRVLAALDDAIANAGGGDVLVASSGGPISVAVQSLLGLDDRRALALNEVITNTSVTRILFSGRRRNLAVFNNYAHLEDAAPELVTFR